MHPLNNSYLEIKKYVYLNVEGEFQELYSLTIQHIIEKQLEGAFYLLLLLIYLLYLMRD